MADVPSIEVAEVLGKQLETASRDLLRDLRTTVVEVLMAAEADAICGAPYRSRSQDRVNARNGYRLRDWDTRVGTIEVAIPKLRSGFVLAGRWWSPVICWGSRPGGWSGWSRPWGSPGCRSRRSARWPRPSTRRSRRFATGRWTPGRIGWSGWTR
ncbi:MAG: putative transposase [Kribbellaceae bacterium]|nr:putative transposase [Kribbellaceae bacterium]